ncbi:DUF885 domain-containing protein [uncultured Ferrimonas sp.]|uniref:DUF885 domain-containing protein n=1 Tax=uncultured Ferrimonas sp. TaxID=432640 RepID=UPI0026231240|nr:DUF885 domain-containing protein [uncultured Ferrimonas sp.]
MKPTGVVLALSLALLGGCQSQPAQQAAAVVCDQACQAQQFNQLSQQFIDELWQIAPEWAVYQGKYEFAPMLSLPNEAERQATLAFVAKWRAQLQAVPKAQLPAATQTDQTLLLNLVDSFEWEIRRFKSWQWNPSQYNVGGVFGRVLSEQWGSEEQVLQAVLQRMQNVPQYYAIARTNLTNPTKEHTELGILQNQGSLQLFSPELLARAKASDLSFDDKANFEQRFLASRQAISSYIAHLEQRLQQMETTPGRSFRIGETLYEEKFALDIQAGMSAKQLYQRAVQDKDKAQQQMVKITEQLWSKYFSKPMPTDKLLAVRQLIDKLSAAHVERENFVSEVRQQIPELVQFVNQHDLLTLDPTKPLVVRETPAYMRGFAGASISAPGPYDNGGNTYYNVTPLDNMGAEEAESYLREYNHWVLQILNIHEAIPGHYAQLVYSNNESSSLVKSLFGNGAMVEGWAVYAERMMLEQGYGDFEPELWLMYWKWNLRVICNTILDYGIQVRGMTEEQGMDLLVNQAFQQQTEASQKWRRATLSQVQLTSYYSGFREIYDLREALKQQQGEDFQLKQFHQQFLSYGSAPVKEVRSLMMSN